MQASYSAFIELQGEHTAAAKVLDKITKVLKQYEGKDNFSLKTSLEENSRNHRPTIWIRATGDRDPKSMDARLTYQVNIHIREILESSHEGISGLYAKTVSVDPVDYFFIPEIDIVEYNTDRNGKVVSSNQVYICDEII